MSFYSHTIFLCEQTLSAYCINICHTIIYLSASRTGGEATGIGSTSDEEVRPEPLYDFLPIHLSIYPPIYPSLLATHHKMHPPLTSDEEVCPEPFDLDPW